MKVSFFDRLVNRISLIGTEKSDNDEIRLQKSLLVICTIPFIIAGAGWGVMYILFGEILAGIIPISYSLISFISLINFSITRRFETFRFSQLLLILLLPFALMLSLGGFVSGSAVILWGLISPLGAMLFDKKSNAPYWLIAFIFLVIISFVIQPFLGIQSNLTESQINMFFNINLIAVSSLIFLMVYYFVGKKNYFQERSETLLLNILPGEIARELKLNGHAEPKHFDSVTVMFTDFKDFTVITETLTPAELVSEIDFLFKGFDKIISKYNIEKIKTIGDSYMCAGGIPVPEFHHAQKVVAASLEIQDFVNDHALESKNKGRNPFQMRIGIHTGPVVAGIVGDRKFAYDIWGDTVNIASRMESSGEPGKVNISGATYELVKQDFNCTFRGKIQVKNKGGIEMYFVDPNG